MQKHIDIKLGDCLIKNVPTHMPVPQLEILAYMNHQGITEIEYIEWRKEEFKFQSFRSSVSDLKKAAEKLSDMGFNKEFLVKQIEMYYDNYEKEKRFLKELDELK